MKAPPAAGGGGGGVGGVGGGRTAGGSGRANVGPGGRGMSEALPNFDDIELAVQAYRSGAASKGKGKSVAGGFKISQLAGGARHGEADRPSDAAAPTDADTRPSNSGA